MAVSVKMLPKQRVFRAHPPHSQGQSHHDRFLWPNAARSKSYRAIHEIFSPLSTISRSSKAEKCNEAQAHRCGLPRIDHPCQERDRILRLRPRIAAAHPSFLAESAEAKLSGTAHTGRRPRESHRAQSAVPAIRSTAGCQTDLTIEV